METDESVDDPFTSEIIRHYLLSAVREMFTVSARVPVSTAFSEGLDFTCALFDPSGKLIAQLGQPAHVGGLEDELTVILEQAGELQDGDVILHNDPFEGADHQSDVVVAMPIVWRDQLVGLSVNRGHWADIGAMFPDGYGLATDLVQEGLIIPVCKLYHGGVVNPEIREFVVRNVRQPKVVWGDILAQVASARTAADRVCQLFDRYGLSRVKRATDYSFEYAERRFRERMDILPNGTFQATDVLDDDGFGRGPYRISVTILKSSEKIVVDFEGTDPQANGAANCSLGCTKAAVYTALKALVDPETPLNSGIRALIDIHCPAGTVVNPMRPAQVCCGAADPIVRVCETVLKCWVDAVPDLVVAASHSTGMNSSGWGRTLDGRDFEWYGYSPGGCGARKSRDGLTMEWHALSTCMNESMEIWESRYPVRFINRQLRIDSGGAGRTRGGLGEERIMECLADTLVSVYADRWASQPWGVHGGLPGASNEFAVQRNGVEQHFTDFAGVLSPVKFSNVQLRSGDRFLRRSGGGGGYGPPSTRNPSLVASDVRNGLVSSQAALEIYRVVLHRDGTVDVQRTAALRKSEGSTS